MEQALYEYYFYIIWAEMNLRKSFEMLFGVGRINSDYTANCTTLPFAAQCYSKFNHLRTVYKSQQDYIVN